MSRNTTDLLLYRVRWLTSPVVFMTVEVGETGDVVLRSTRATDKTKIGFVSVEGKEEEHGTVGC